MNSVREQSPSPSYGSPQKLTLPPLNVKTYLNSPIDQSPRNPVGGLGGGKFGMTAPLDLSIMTMTTPDLRGGAPEVS
jgi:hypothetical protein